VFVKNLMSLLGLQQILAAQALAEEVAIGKFADPYRRAQLCYLVSMMYARFLPERDLDRAEQLLDEGLEELERADIPPDVLHFQSVFNRNGLALVRFFQGRHAEAIDLCLSGFARLKEHLSPEQHRLHRSVLLYNIAQVYSALGMDDDAIRHYTLAMEMDPNFSEYYNERANLHFRAGRYEEALRDYQMAGELSPPYFELYTNLGQCHRHLGHFEEAAAAYSKALDLEPGQVLALLGRAQCEEALGQAEAALADYDEALALAPGQWEALANRATLHYDRGDLPGALKDMEAAIELAPQVAALYQNRGFLHSELGMTGEAARDFSTYLRLDPEAEDRGEVLARLQDLQALASGNF
jgi:tetratricopeptide (TPR) repeat protein